MGITGLGRLSVYEPRGSYQIIFELLEPKGVGALQVAFEQLKARLSEEGLFDDEHKKRLPFLPQKIAVITSPRGAAVQDIINVAVRRFDTIQLNIIPVQVQGDKAENEIAEALAWLNTLEGIDVAIVARGGGSMEDLQAFNSEKVARAIFNSTVPIVSAVGHETDYTIADFVADLRAPTPSAAAELVIPLKHELFKQCLRLKDSLTICIYNYIEQWSLLVRELSKRLVDPRRSLQDMRLRIDDLTVRFIRAMHHILRIRRERKNWVNARLGTFTPFAQVEKFNVKLNTLNHNLHNIFINNSKIKYFQLSELVARLKAISPQAILSRGYSITRTIPDAKVVKNAMSVKIGQDLEIQLAKGALTCQVGGKSSDGKKNF
jgi:exodeoxyribonuclease VII large subunit